MFNGIIYNQGIIKKIVKRPKGINIFIKSKLKVSNLTLIRKSLNNCKKWARKTYNFCSIFE